MTRGTLLAVVAGSVAMALVAVAAVVWAVGSTFGLFQPQVQVTVVNDEAETVDLTCLWDNRDGVRPGQRVVMPVSRGSSEDCAVDGHDGTYFGCLVLDARGAMSTEHEMLLSTARLVPDETKCSI